MPRQNRKKYVQLPRSGDALTDWFFRQFAAQLKSERIRVARKKRLTNPDDPHRRIIRGLMDPSIRTARHWIHIFINSAKNTHRCRDEEVETLIHELAHVVLPEAPERHILSIERILAKRFTRDQRSFLKGFLPRHEIKCYPKPLIADRIEKVATA